MIVVNVSAEPVLVGGQYLLPKERREVSRREYERAKANHPEALQELGATPPAAKAETPAEDKPKRKSTRRRKKNVTETKTKLDTGPDSAVNDDRDTGAGAGD